MKISVLGGFIKRKSSMYSVIGENFLTGNRKFKRRLSMYDKNELCEKIKSIYPDIGLCGIDIKVEYDEDQKMWVLFLKKGNREAKHFLEDEDLKKCMAGQQCVSLGLEVSQIKD